MALTQVQPIWADKICDSFGVNVHYSWGTTVYGNTSEVTDLVIDLGVRHIRDRTAPSAGAQWTALADLYAAGIKMHGTSVIYNETTQGELNDICDAISQHPQWYSSVGGCNEPNNDADGRLSNWASITRNHQVALWNTMITYGVGNIPVGAPSLKDNVNDIQADYAALAATDIYQYMDYGDFHKYPLGGGGTATPSNQFSNRIDYANNAYHNKPLFCTETGMNDRNGHTPAWVVGVYAPRLLMEPFYRGVKRTWLYELLDDPDPSGVELESHFGLVATPVGSTSTPSMWSKKPAFLSLRALSRAMADPGSAVTPAPIGLSVTGGGSDLRWICTGKRDGTYQLVIWRDVAIWNHNTDTAVTVTPNNITVASSVGPTKTFEVLGELMVVDLGTGAAAAPGDPVDPTPATTNFAGHVPGRVLLGMAASESNKSALPFAEAQRVLGQPFYEWRKFTGDWVTKTWLNARLDEAKAKGWYPVLSVKVPGNNWAGVTAGSYDAGLDDVIAVANSRTDKWAFAIHHEPDGDGNLATWASMQEYVSDYLAGVKAKVAFVCIGNGHWFGPKNYDGTKIAAAFPNSLITTFNTNNGVVMVDSYDSGDPTMLSYTQYDRTSKKMQAFVDWARTKNINAIGWGEFGCHTGEDVTRCWNIMSANADIVGIANYFNSGENSRANWLLVPDSWTVTNPLYEQSGTDATVTGTPESEARLLAFRAALSASATADPAVIPNPGPAPAPAPTPVVPPTGSVGSPAGPSGGTGGLPVRFVSPGGAFTPSSVELYGGGGQVTTAVGASPQWTTEDGNTSYISFTPAGNYSIATFYFTGNEGVPQSWFDEPKIKIQAVCMNEIEVDWTFITMYWADTNTNFYKLRNYYSPVIGSGGVYNYHTNTFNITTDWPGPDPEDPDPGAALYGLGGYANGATAENWAANAWAAYQAGTFQVSFWVGGGSGDGLPTDEIRVSYFALVLDGEVPDLTGEFEMKRRRYARSPTRYTP